MAFISPVIDVSIIAVIVAIISFIIQRKFVDKKSMKEMQARMKEQQATMKELWKQNTPEAKEKADKMQMEMMQETTKMMQGSMKSMIVVMVIVIPTFALCGFLYNDWRTSFIGHYPFLNALPDIIKGYGGSLPDWTIVYIVIGLIASIVIQVLSKIIEMILKKTRVEIK